MISNYRTLILRGCRYFSAKKPQGITKVVKPSKTKEEEQHERLLAMKEREALTKWLEELGNHPPRYMGAFFCGAALPLFLQTYGLIVTPYDDPIFLDHLKRIMALIVGQSVLFVSFFYAELSTFVL